jgi:predicted unusual protein kinase regulating ubiquinone biosynthesis (AarF/ABC1/UbiB family)
LRGVSFLELADPESISNCVPPLGFWLGGVSGNLERNKTLRAKQFVDLLTDLGPTFVKIGQALSIRADLVSPEYIQELRTLQDR